jgi:site-specific DNA-methyltransferase (cytosine-N4-specific)
VPSRVPSPGWIRLFRGDAAELGEVADHSIDLVVTSPPYPMIPIWDDLFRRLGAPDYRSMHARLEAVWKSCYRSLVAGGILAINIGDAVRSEDARFQLWPNHATVIGRCTAMGFVPLPYILWQKPTNRPNAFLGSGFLPPNAYVTLDCEFILLFRKGSLRQFPQHDPRRSLSRYSRAERDRWFTQVWTGIRGARQGTSDRRTAAFPPEIPRRLIRMFSRVGDTILDPFAGTGTTLWVASELGRNAIGVEIDPGVFAELRRKYEGRTRPPATPRGARVPHRPRA